MLITSLLPTAVCCHKTISTSLTASDDVSKLNLHKDQNDMLAGPLTVNKIMFIYPLSSSVGVKNKVESIYFVNRNRRYEDNIICGET